MWETAVLAIALVSSAAIVAVFGRHDHDAATERLDRIEDLLLKLTEYGHDEYALHEYTNAQLDRIAASLYEHNERETDRDKPRLHLAAPWPSDENGLR